ncbi:hypothetical protein [Desulfonatronum thiodismutans]|nr:hypothetical protein [Desulfonatronum thiodismutans]
MSDLPYPKSNLYWMPKKEWASLTVQVPDGLTEISDLEHLLWIVQENLR